MASDSTFVAITAGFVYVALIMEAWSRRVVGYAIGRRIDARLAVAACEGAITLRSPLPGCVFHTDRGSQHASEQHMGLIGRHGFSSSMIRRGTPYDDPQAESFMKTIKVEAVCLNEYEAYEDVTADPPGFIEDVYNARDLPPARSLAGLVA